MTPIGLHDLALGAIPLPGGGPTGALIALALLLTVVGVVLAFVRNLRLLSSSSEDALTDPLTGLGNRRKLMEDLEDELARASESDPRVVVLLDLDGFKRYNDAFGHPAGDVLLGRLGNALGAVARPWGSAYRLGGDEFCVLVHDRTAGLETIVAAAAGALSDHGEGFSVRPSCGMVAVPAEADTPESALELADQRLYARKSAAAAARPAGDARAVLVRALREREESAGDELDGLASLAREVGRRLSLSSDEVDVMVRATELHDVGKVAVPDSILSKREPLTEEEWGYVRQHTLVGARILSASPATAPVAKVVRASHERWDGSGYPDGLAGQEIPIGARIVSACDAYHAMTSTRAYRAALTPAAALEELQRFAGHQFDPAVVEVLCETVAGHAGPAPRRAVRPLRSLVAGAAMALAALALPAAALAGTASVSTGQLSVVATTGEANNLLVSLDGLNVRVAESGASATLTSGTGCGPAIEPNQVLCSLAGVTSVNVDAGDANDTVAVTVALPATLLGGPGYDTLTGGPLADTLDGGTNGDTLDGGLGGDDLIGGANSDWVNYATRTLPVTADLDDVADDGEPFENDNVRSDVETLAGGSGNDTLTGNLLDNGLDGGLGADTLAGGGGADWVMYWTRTSPVQVDFDGVADDGESGENDVLAADIENVIGGAGNDTLVGDGVANRLYGFDGNDTMDGGGGADNFYGGNGSDLVSYEARSAPVTADLDGVADDGETAEGDLVATDVEDLTGGLGGDALSGSAVGNVLHGGPGEDTLDGQDGADTLDGGDDVDTLNSGVGDDSVRSRDDFGDDVACNDGDDAVVGDHKDTIDADCENIDRGPLDEPDPDPLPEPTPTPTPEPEPEPEPEPDLEAIAASVRNQSVTLDEKGNAKVRVSCPLEAIGGCRGKITLKLAQGKKRGKARAEASAKKKSKKRKGVLGSGSFSLEPGQSLSVKVKLSRNGRRRVLRKKKVRCSVKVEAVDDEGNRTVTDGAITLKAPKLPKLKRNR